MNVTHSIAYHLGAHQVYSLTTWNLVATALCHRYHNNDLHIHTIISVRFIKGFCIDYCHQCRIIVTSVGLLSPV